MACPPSTSIWPTALLALVPLILNLCILAYSYRKLTLDAQNVLYMLFVVCAVSWQAFDLSVRLSATAETATFFRGYFRPGQLLAIHFGLHFVMLFCGRERVAWSAWFWALLYLPPILEIGSMLSGTQHEVLVYREGWGWVADPDHMHGAFLAYLLYGSALGIACVVLLFDHTRRVWNDPARRAASMMLLVGMSLVVSTGMVFEAVLPWVGLRQWPVTSTACFAFSLAVLWGQLRFRLFSVSTHAAAKAVVETVTDTLIVADAHGALLFANDSAAKNLGLDPDRISRPTSAPSSMPATTPSWPTAPRATSWQA